MFNSLNSSTCDSCKCFFRRYSRKLGDNNTTRPLCNQNCYLTKDKISICSICKYGKCLSVGLDKIKLEYQDDNDLHLNENSFNDMRNLSIEISSPLNLTNDTHLIKLINKEVGLRKNQIRLEHNELRIKYYLAEMSEKISNYLISNLKLNESFMQSISNKAKNLFDTSNNKQLLIAYQCLIDESLNFNSNSIFDLRIKHLLNKIYSSNHIKTNDKNKNNKLLKVSPGTTSFGVDINLDELKTFHFILLLFSSFQSLDDFIRIDNTSVDDKSTSLFNSEIAYCQKTIIKLIDHLCHYDKFIKTQILLSVSEIDFF